MRNLAPCALALLAALASAQSKPPTAAEALKNNFEYINTKALEMAQDFPENKYGYKLKPEMRASEP
jgi:pyridoxine/pyridoxamine 5'-phosphate oxidase